MSWKDTEQGIAYSRAYRLKHKEALKARRQEVRKNDPRLGLLAASRKRAKLKSIAHTITLEDIILPELCPAFGFPLVMNEILFQDNSPTLDRIDPTLGYIPGNIQVISYLANRAKNSMTVPQQQMFAKWLLSVTE